MTTISAKSVCGAVYQAPQTEVLEMIGNAAIAQSFNGGNIDPGQSEEWGNM